MNIISNTCLGGFYYQELGLPFGNPFIWTLILHEQFVDLCRNYDTINFGNITGTKLANTIPGSNDKRIYPTLTIDGKIDLRCLHIVQGDSQKEPYKVGNNVYCSNPIEHATSTYFRRLDRMLSDPDPPIFMFYYFDRQAETLQTIREFFSLDIPYERYFVTYFPTAIEYLLDMGIPVDTSKIAFYNIGNRGDRLAHLAEKKFQLKRRLTVGAKA